MLPKSLTSHRERSERGSALVLAVFVLALLAMMGLALVGMSEREMKMSHADLRSKKSFYLAEAGIDHGRLALFDTNVGGSFDDDLLDASGGSLGNKQFDINPLNLIPLYDSNGLLTGFSAGVGDDVPLVGVTPFADGAYAAFLSNDPVDPTDTDDENERVMLTGIGAGPDRSLEIVQAIIEKDPLLFSFPQAAITILGPPPVWDPGTSSAKLYEGDDCGVPGGGVVPAVGAIGSSSTDQIKADMGKPTYRSGTEAPVDTIADLTDPTQPGVATAIDAAWTDCFAVRDMIEEIRGIADVVCTDQACVLPPAAPDRIVFVDADYTLSTGEGLIVVTGRLDLINEDWDGIIMAIGEGVVARDGGGITVYSGAIIVADIAGPDNIYGNADDCTTAPDGFGQAEWWTDGGGSSTVQYCSQKIDPAQPQRIYMITEFLQR